MNIKFYKIFLLIFCLCFWISCDDPEDSSDNINDDSNQDESTLNEDSVGSYQANLQDMLFYNLESSIDYEYDYYSVDGIGYGNTITFPCSIRESDVVDFYTFPEYLIEAYNCSDDLIICEDDNTDYDIYINESLLDETYDGLCSCQCLDDEGFAVDCGSNDAASRSYSQPATPPEGACQNSIYDNKITCETNGWIWFASTIDCSLMDANQDCEMTQAEQSDLVNNQSTDFSISYTNLEKLSWDEEAKRYKPQVSSDQVLDQTVTDESDLYDESNYWTIINQWQEIDGMVYIDHAQWNDTTLLYEEQPIDEEDIDIVLDHTFYYNRTILNSDSLMFRINSDCNNDGIWTEAEEYGEVGVDGCPSIYEDGNNGCVCNYHIDSELNECTSEDAICTPDSENELLCADGSDPNLDNWQNGYDILIYTDGNLQYDEGEPFIDRFDGLELPEIFWDIPIGDSEEGNGVKDALEPWQDLNCNNIYIDDWLDPGNGIWDDDEHFQDLDGNGEWNDNEPLYRTSSSPNQIIVNYDTNGDQIVDGLDDEPQIINEIDPDEINQAMIYMNAGYQFYNEIIQEISDSSYQYYKYTPIERIETIYSNELIEDIPSDLISNEYYVTKTSWETLPDGTDVDGDGIPDRFYDYDYHLFRYADEGLTKLVHPSYFYHYGYFETPDEIEDGFYETSDLIQDIMIYTVSGELREGERVTSFETLVVDSNNDGVDDMQYEVNKEFEVEYEYIDVPIRKNLGELVDESDPEYNCSEGQMLRCFSDGLTSCVDEGSSSWAENECGEKVNEITECSSDTTLAAYKIIRTKNILMIGNGVEFGERNTVWLAAPDPNSGDPNQIGIIMDKLEHRWTEDYWSEEDALDWKEFSRIELKSNSQEGENNLLGRLLNNGKVINLDDFENEGPLNNDPYISKPTGIIQRVRLPHE